MTPLRSRSTAVEDSAGFDYLATDAHYRSLARRIVTALGGERGVVLVTSEPPASPLLISEAISGEASARFSVIGVSGGPELTCDGLARAVPALAARSAALFVLDEADRLSDAQIEEVYEAVLHGDRTVAAAVLLAGPSFLARLERPGLHFLKDGSVAHLDFQQLGPDEIGPFLRHEFRLPADAALLSAESLSAIAGATKGDPGMVSRLARRLLQDGGAKSAAPITLTPPENRPGRADVEAEKAGSAAEAAPKPVEATAADEAEPAAEATTGEVTATDEPRPSDAAILGSLDEISQAITDAAGESTGTAHEPDAADKELTASLLNQPVGSAAPPPKPSVPPTPAVEPRPTPKQTRARRIRLAVLVCAAYLAVVSVASVIVFALLHPAAPPHVAETKGEVGSWLSKTKENLGDKRDDQVAAVKSAQTPAPARSATPAPAATDDKPARTPSPPSVTTEAMPNTPAVVAPAPKPKEKVAADAAPTSEPAPAAPADTAPPPLPPALPGEPSTTAADASAGAPPMPKAKPPVPATETKTADAAPVKPAALPAAPAAPPPPAAPAPAAAAPAAPSVTAPSASAPAAPAPATTVTPAAKPSLSAAEIAELKARGDALLNTGDIVSARLFYERAGEAGDAQAALMAGETFDPAVLLRAGVRGVRGDAAQAAEWYRRASALGADEAARRLKSLGQ